MATQIQKRQIADSAIDDSKIQAGAGIVTTKLAEGADFVKRNGAVPFTSNQSAGGNKLTDIGTATNPGDAVNLSLLDTRLSSIDSLYTYRSVRVASTANVTIATSPAAIDGVTLVSGDRILLKDQTAQAENGIYTYTSTGNPLTRAADTNAWNEITGLSVQVIEGTANNDTRYKSTANSGGTLGTTAIVFSADAANGLTTANFVSKEVPTGAINGVNTAFTMANTPLIGTEEVFLNGVLQESGAGNDYTISGASITMLFAPLTGEKLRITYRK